MLSEKEKIKRKSEKELKSFRNKMGSNIIWFDSLGKTKQYDLLFGWKRVKKYNLLTKPVYVLIKTRIPLDPLRPWGKKKVIKKPELKYPPSLKHYIKSCKSNSSFRPKVQKLRETTIDALLKSK